ncbi:MAG: signal peptidase I [Lachnospiraceae bacterium]|nr:signal peptidase I [Lachnospiraceae bacterium]
MGFKKKNNDKKIEHEAENQETSVDEEKVGQEEAATSEPDDNKDDAAEADEPKSKPRKKSKRKQKKQETKPEDVNIVKELLSLIVYIGIVVLLCYFIINFVGCRSRVDGNSMNPTLSDNDNLWVDKLSYTFGKPDRFDVIIFNYDEQTTYVKRIIGLPGETVRIDQQGQIFINEQLLVENYGLETIRANNLGRANQPVLLGEDEYFVLGDNRNNSSDSRWPDVGNVNKEDIVGKVVLRIYPFSSFGIVK